MKILWISNAPSIPTGFGRQTATWLPRLRAAGHDVILFALGGHDGAPGCTPDGTPTLPRLFDANGNDVVLDHFKHVGADVAITLGNASVCDPEKYRTIPWCSWSPVNTATPTSTDVTALYAARWVWAMSRHNEQALRDAGIPCTYVPHGIDSKQFAPHERGTARARLATFLHAEIEDRFVVVMVAKNFPPPRKGFAEAFEAWRLFSRERTDAVLCVFSNVTPALGGQDLRTLARGIDRIVFAPQYEILCGMVDPDILASAYSAADVYLSASHGESFGLPALEAQMCGCPVILPDNTAQREMCLTGTLATTLPYAMPGHGTWAKPDIAALVAALHWAYEKRGDLALRATTREHALVYDADRVFAEYMKPALDKIAQEIS